MAVPVKTPILKDVTTNTLFPAYKTRKGTVIQLNSPKTVMPSGGTLAALVAFVDNSGLKTVVITGGAETSGHSTNSFHGKDLAIDVAGKRFNKLTHDQARIAALNAGFTHGIYEDFRGTGKDHWHFQIGTGNGLGDKHKLSNKQLLTKHPGFNS